jgi:hypothetical protein
LPSLPGSQVFLSTGCAVFAISDCSVELSAAWWLSRELSESAELACDAAAVEQIDNPAGYTCVNSRFCGCGVRKRSGIEEFQKAGDNNLA